MKTTKTVAKYDNGNNLQWRSLEDAPFPGDTPFSVTGVHVNREYDLTVPADMVRYVARERFAWPGGDELALVTDGLVVCQGCVRERYALELQDAIDSTYRDTAIMCGAEIDPGDCFCENCSKDISSYCD